jgi:hypothetical protein
MLNWIGVSKGVQVIRFVPLFFERELIMRKEYKLTDRGLIRSFGKIDVTLDETIGNRFVSEGKARINTRPSSPGEKRLYGPPSHKAVFQPPEEKAFEEFGDNGVARYPGIKDRLFPHIAK